jgi:hypothetical protein
LLGSTNPASGISRARKGPYKVVGKDTLLNKHPSTFAEFFLLHKYLELRYKLAFGAIRHTNLPPERKKLVSRFRLALENRYITDLPKLYHGKHASNMSPKRYGLLFTGFG